MTRAEKFLVKRIQRATLRKHNVLPSRQKRTRAQSRRQLLPAEKQELKRKRDERRAEVDAAITEGHEAIWDIAVRLAGKFPKHNAEYWFHEIMRTPMKKLNNRRVNL